VFEKIFHTASYRRKLPVPFFEVLDQEYAALHGGATTTFSWDFAADHLREPTAGLLEKIKPLLSDETKAQLPQSETKEALVEWLNKLLHTPSCLYFDTHFPKAGLTKETIAMTRLELDPSELTRLNRLLLEEAFPEHLRKIADIHLEGIYSRIHAGEGNTALCFSGGGIRSATFALGIAQGLARRGLLKHFDYLSTVSGGGYIGSWLSSWIHHTGNAETVFNQLKGGKPDSITEPEPKPVNHLRKYSNYLTPKLGMFSADTWVLVAIYLRNLFLNWLVFFPILLALFAVPRVHASLLNLQPPDWIVASGFVLGFILLAWGMAYSSMNRPALRSDLKANGGAWFFRRNQRGFIIWCFAPICCAALCVTTAWSWTQSGMDIMTENAAVRWLLEIIHGKDGAPGVLHYSVLGAALHLTGWAMSEMVLKRWRGGKWSALRWEFLLAIVTGAVGGIFLWVAATLSIRHASSPIGLMLYGCFAAPLFIGIFLVAAAVFIGVSSEATSNQDREWWARMGAWLLIAIVSWSLFSVLVLFGPVGILALPKILVPLGGLSGLFTLIVGHHAGTAANRERKAQESRISFSLDKLLVLAAPLSLAALVAGLSFATSALLIVAAQKLNPLLSGLDVLASLSAVKDFCQVATDSPWWLTGGMLAGGAFAGWALSRFINVNKFSLHAIYRNRLVRAYLGASNCKRDPNPFTGFDPADNLPMQLLRDPGNSSLPQRPLHIINMALNLVTGENLAWQQRKAETFTASTLHCGNYRLGYRFTKHYAQSGGKYGREPRGITLGTAVAISGAAASPNQGYHSSPMVALLMTLFNVRLGWWLGNPGAMGHDTFRDSAPRSPVHHMVKEGLGLTDSTSRYVYLSDGGHFENLGLYEMVLRRCRLIVVSDAGSDSDYSLEDLGNAIRKIRVDLGIKIELRKFEIYSRADEQGKKSGRYCAIGEIDYDTADAAGRKGLLIYIKPALLGDEPRDIYNYARSNKDFPHETTGDQWFSESQFESYRALGARVVDWIYAWKSSSIPESNERATVLEDFVKQAYTASETPLSPNIGDLFKPLKPPG